MSERDTYPAGVPCWVTNLQHDVPAAAAFYAALFGWEARRRNPSRATSWR